MINILGIETSCDETAASIVQNGRNLQSNEIYSQIETHEKYGGVVPEIASRNHLEKIDIIVENAIKNANLSLDDLDAIAVTNRPGLVGALLVGLSFGKSLAYARNLPLIGVNHIEAHLAANYLESDLTFPYIGLVLSGGHSHIFKVNDYLHYEVLGQTRDDAVGEAFDKVARSIGLGYPGGPKIDKASQKGNPLAIEFPRTYFKDSLDFSFSGIKSAVLNYLNTEKMKENEIIIEDVAASFQLAVVEVLVTNAIKACKENNINTLALAGGVASNTLLRSEMEKACKENNIRLYIPSPILCTDNAAMVASHGYYLYREECFDTLDLNAIPSGQL